MSKLRPLRSEIGILTCFVEHLIALIQNEDLEVVEFESLLLDQGEHSTRGSNDDVRALFFVFEKLLVILYWHSSEHDCASQLRKILGESFEFLLDLESKLPDIAKDQG